MKLETEHFKISHAHWNAGTHWPEWFIEAKENATCFVPTLASSYTDAESLVELMHEAERAYVDNANDPYGYRS